MESRPSLPEPVEALAGSKPLNLTGLTSHSGEVVSRAHGERTLSYHHHIQFKGASRYTINPVTLTDGSLRGQKVLLLMEYSYTFTQLPPEVRLIIYRLLLRSCNPFVVWRPRVQPQHTGNRVARTWTKGVHATDGIFSENSNKYHDKPSIYTFSRYAISRFCRKLGLLRTNKMIHQEASAVLYGEKSFTIDRRNIIDFLTSVGTHSRFMHDVFLVGLDPSRVMPVIGQLSHTMLACPGLRTIRLDHRLFCGHRCMPGSRITLYSSSTHQHLWTARATTFIKLLSQCVNTIGLDPKSLLMVMPDAKPVCRSCTDNNGHKCAECLEEKSHCEDLSLQLQQMLCTELDLMATKRIDCSSV